MIDEFIYGLLLGGSLVLTLVVMIYCILVIKAFNKEHIDD